MRWVNGILLLLLVALQYRLWFGDVGEFAKAQLTAEHEQRARRLASLEARNDRLRDEVVRLKADDAALEGVARLDLGMIKPGETFYFVPDSALARSP